MQRIGKTLQEAPCDLVTKERVHRCFEIESSPKIVNVTLTWNEVEFCFKVIGNSILFVSPQHENKEVMH